MLDKKILIIGGGGIGSYLVAELNDVVAYEQISPYTKFCVADADIVELKQLRYQKFDEAGKNKAKSLKKMYDKILDIQAYDKRITREGQLIGFGIIILCVDNEKTRKLVMDYCYKTNKEFIDLRATGRRIFALPKQRLQKDSLKFVDEEDNREYSCQEKEDKEQGRIQLGNRIVARIGVQMLLNLLRGHSNKILSVVI